MDTTVTTVVNPQTIGPPELGHTEDLTALLFNWTMVNTTTTNTTNINTNASSCPCRMDVNQSCCRGYVIPPEFFLPPPLSSEMQALLTSLYALVMVAALLANSAVIVVVVWARMLRSFTDTFILSLAVSDLLVAGFNMPVRLLNEVWNEWRLGLAACRLTEYLQGVTIVNNILTLTAIAIDRYLVICHEHAPRRLTGRQRTVGSLLAVWGLSLLAVVPQLFITRLDMRIKRDSASLEITGQAWVCAEVFSDRERRLYTLTIYACVYVLPMVVMGYAYGSIARRLWRRDGSGSQARGAAAAALTATSTATASCTSTSAVVAATTTTNNGASQARSYPQFQTALARRRRVTIMMVTLVLAFTLLWLPFFSASLYLEFGGREKGVDEARFRAARDFLQLVGYCTCCLNPVIYTFLNRNFQDQLCALCCRPQRVRVEPSVVRAPVRSPWPCRPRHRPPSPPVVLGASMTPPHVPEMFLVESSSCGAARAGVLVENGGLIDSKLTD